MDRFCGTTYYVDYMKELQNKYRSVSPILEHCSVEKNLAKRMGESLNRAADMLQNAWGRKEILK